MSQTSYIARFIFQVAGSNQTIVPGRGKYGSRSRKYYFRPSPDAVLPISGIEVGVVCMFDAVL